MSLFDSQRFKAPEFWHLAMLGLPIGVFVLMVPLMALTGVFSVPFVGENLNARQAFTFLGAMLFPLGAFILAKTEYNRARAVESLGWPATQGEVRRSEVSSRLVKFGRRYRLLFACDYVVAGRGYRTEKVQFGSGWVTSRDLIEAFAASYPVGSRPTVYYDPDDPQEAVVERTDQVASDNGLYAWVCFGAPLLAALVVLLKFGEF